MGRKKKKASKPWCWYCNREFDDEKILVQHQKAKHFKCHICHKKLYTGPGLSIHCMQVHKETVDKVPNSLPNRSNIEVEIFGMDGIPAEDVREHERQKNGGKSDSDDDEPAAKKKVEIPLTAPPPMMMPPNMMPPMMGQFGPMGMMPNMPPMAPMPPFLGPGGIPMMPPHMMPPRPLFPAAMAATTSAAAVHAAAVSQKPTFPAYSNATISAPPTTNNPSATGSTAPAEAPKAPATAPSGTAAGVTSKIMHPPEDMSLEELRARKPKYQQKLQNSGGSNSHQQRTTSAGTLSHNHNTVVSSTSSMTIPTSSSTSSAAAAAQAAAISKAQETAAMVAVAQVQAAQAQAQAHVQAQAQAQAQAHAQAQAQAQAQVQAAQAHAHAHAAAHAQAAQVQAQVAQAQAHAHAQVAQAVAAQHQQQQQKQLEDLNRAVLLQRLQAGRSGHPQSALGAPTATAVGMMPLPGQMQLMQPMLRPAMALGPHGPLLGGNMLRAPGGLPGMPGEYNKTLIYVEVNLEKNMNAKILFHTLPGLLPVQAIQMPGMPMPGMGVMLPAGHPVLQMMPRFR
ncbi:BUB3-interacting and GLEBS motif-containing protein ZNF207 isoform X1 [Rhagoletis pomonella]|uniref:BUB3-interacting and GLEBS motif-containing protein ZNF207 isoform X1 n=1 Tax=Rhagoletis pomonella TaxID=28610 RepID=UPI00177F51E7|nr:BUB3-interacting and GLEBS motif-containing protein ZNF207 isoform X1 [Rhagoletis pomonella]